MHDYADHQASGLASFARSRGARLAAMVSHGDKVSELSLLWRLCLTWVELGYPVTVLDAGSRESLENPGLEQLLDFPHTPLLHHQDSTVWNVMPAADGLRTLLQPPELRVDITQRFAGLFPDDSVVLVYGNAGVLSQLLTEHALQPLMVVSSARESLLSSYQALKRLMRAPGLVPLVIDQSAQRSRDAVRQPSAAETLADCAKNFLSLDLPRVHLPSLQDEASAALDLQGLALRVLENALPLHGRWTQPASSGAMMNARSFSRSY